MVAEPLSEVFADAQLEVSFRYPAGFRAVAFSHDESSDVVLVEGGEGQSFQVFTQPFDEDVALSPERIRQDVPDKVIDEARVVTVNGVEAPKENGIGQTGRAWQGALRVGERSLQASGSSPSILTLGTKRVSRTGMAILALTRMA